MNFKLLKEKLIKAILFLCAVSSIGIVFFIVGYMVWSGFPVIVDWFAHGFGENSTSNILPYMFATVYVGLGGTIVGIIIGLPCAIYLAEFANMRIRNMIKPTLEVLNGFPSVIIGLVGFVIICSQIGRYFYGTMGSVLAGWIVLGVMSLPLIACGSEDSIRAVPAEFKEASLGLGATRWQTTIKVLLPSAFSGIITAILLALMNALGETMAVLLVIGPSMPPPITLNPLVGTAVITTKIALSYAETGPGSPEWTVNFAAGTILFVMTAALNLATRAIMNRKGTKSVGTTQ
jgi:phosphate transport system permease protein